MKKISEITQEDIKLFQEVIAYHKAGKEELVAMRYLMNTYIDKGANVCSFCKSQINFFHKRIKKWYAKNEEAILGVTKVNTCKNCDKDISHRPPAARYCDDNCKVEYKNK